MIDRARRVGECRGNVGSLKVGIVVNNLVGGYAL